MNAFSSHWEFWLGEITGQGLYYSYYEYVAWSETKVFFFKLFPILSNKWETSHFAAISSEDGY